MEQIPNYNFWKDCGSRQAVSFSLFSNYLQWLKGVTQVKCQAGYRRDPGNPTRDPRWEWRDPALGGGIPPFPPGMKI